MCLFTTIWADVLVVTTLHLLEFLLIDAITLSVHPLVTLLAAHEVVVAVFRSGLHADRAVGACLKESVARRAEPLLAIWVPLIAPFIPFCVVEFVDWAQFLIAAQALDAVIAIPARRWHLLERWVQTVDVHSNIAHLANDYHVLLVGELAHVANLAILTLPRKHRTSSL